MNETLVRDAHNEPSKTCMRISYKHFTALLGKHYHKRKRFILFIIKYSAE